MAGVEDVVADDEFFSKMEALLSKLVPPDNVEVSTIHNEKVKLPGALAARRQVVVFRLMRELIETPAVRNAISGETFTDASSILEVVMALSTNETVAEKLGDIFSAAYPDAVEGHPLDVLPLEELVAALVPFSERFLKRVGTGLTAMAAGATELG